LGAPSYVVCLFCLLCLFCLSSVARRHLSVRSPPLAAVCCCVHAPFKLIGGLVPRLNCPSFVSLDLGHSPLLPGNDPVVHVCLEQTEPPCTSRCPLARDFSLGGDISPAKQLVQGETAEVSVVNDVPAGISDAEFVVRSSAYWPPLCPSVRPTNGWLSPGARSTGNLAR